jgi:hypothetical protein
MGNIIDLLLETDVNKFAENNKKDYEIKRLSEMLGETFTITCHALTDEQVEHVSEISTNNTEIKYNTVIESCRIEGKRFNNKEIMDKFGVFTPKELLKKLLLPGEIYALYRKINTLSGYGVDVVKEIKNL